MQDKPIKKFEPAATSGQHPRIDKIIQLQNLFTKAINEFKVKVQYVTATRQICISGALQQVHSQGFKIQNSQIFFQNSEMKMLSYLGTFPFQIPVYLKYQYCADTLIRIKYKKLSDSPKNTNNTQINKLKNQSSNYTSATNSAVTLTSSNLSLSKSNTTAPKERNKERTIGQVLQIVKKWKNAQVDESGIKIRTLNEAADMIGVCKKTLEDYAYQIQFGYEFNFDFQKNKHYKIGLLRSFVKTKRKQLAVLNNIDNYWNFQSSNSDQDLKKGR